MDRHMSAESTRLLVVGAHPDDPDLKAGGLAALYARLGNEVRFLAMTDGGAGHHELTPERLIERRRAEARAAAAVIGIEYRILNNPDGELEPTLDTRRELIREIRAYDPDLLLTHRPADYHPDHRYTAQLVRDSAYMVTVPHICPDTPALRRDPVIGYLPDTFERPVPYTPHVVFSIDEVIEDKLEMLHQHESQMYEWLPYNRGISNQVPDGADRRRAWLEEDRLPSMRDIADRYRDVLTDRYGHDRADGVEYAEAVEISEYGSDLTEEAAEELFPF